MRVPGMRKLAALAVPFALAAGALAFTATPAHAIQGCTTNTMLLAAAQAAENEGDNWVASEEVFIDDDNYEAANCAYIQAGIAVNPVTGAVGQRELVLDQSMIMVSLDNALNNRAIQRDRARDPVYWAAHTYLSLEKFSI
jgi:hypothetical protein